MQDYYGNYIHIKEIPNPHLLITGMSGMGKTFFLNRYVEKCLQKENNLFVLDYSSSFSEKELAKANFKYPELVYRLNLSQEKFEIPVLCGVEERQRGILLADLLAEAVDIVGFMQKRIFHRICTSAIKKKDIFSAIEEEGIAMYDRCLDRENVGQAQLIDKIMNKLEPLLSLSTISFPVDLKSNYVKAHEKKVLILEMYEMADATRNAVTKLLISSFWQERKRGMGTYKTLILDEIQYLSLKDGTAFASLLREGRKFDSQVVMTTQYFPDKLTELLEQAANWMVFRPTKKEIGKIAKLLGGEKFKDWIPILYDLQVGEAVFSGSFTVNQNQKIHEGNVIVKI